MRLVQFRDPRIIKVSFFRPSSVNSQGNGSQRGGSRASRPKSNTSNASNELERMIEEEMQNGEGGELRSV